MRKYVPIFAATVVLVGCGGGHKSGLPVKPGAAPPPPTHNEPSCGLAQQKEIQEGKGYAGICAPAAPASLPLTPGAVRRGATGPDVSNNDPISAWGAVKAHGHSFAYNKVIQGTGFVDSTAAGMTSLQRSAGIIPGGYDFLEVCRTSATGEARLYASRLKAIGLIKHAFVPIGDAEWPLSIPCSAIAARQWLFTWQNELFHLVHRWPGYYTGAWWWNPNVGCWRPPHAVRWVSGYTLRSRLPIPCGWNGVDLWQYTDHGFNGATTTDMNVLEASAAMFEGPELSPAQKLAAKAASLRSHEKERAELHKDIDSHHCRPGQHNTPRQPERLRLKYHRLCGRWLHRGGVVILTIKRLKHELGGKG